MRKLGLALGILVAAWACKHSIDELNPSVTGVAPSNMVYSVDSLAIVVGDSASSVIPSIEGNLPMNYYYAVTPISFGAINLDSMGVVHVDSTLPEGEYLITVTATNNVGAATFNDIFKVKAVAPNLPPTGFSYPTDTLLLQNGDGGTSGVPTVTGTPPFSFTSTSAPATSDIAIDAATGEILVATALADGTYTVDATVTNGVGSQTITGALTVIVSSNPFPPTNLVYPVDTLFLLSGSGGNSGVPTVSGTAPFTFSHVSSPASGDITINTTNGEITIATSIPDGTYNVDATASNASGSTTLTNALVVVVSSVVLPPANLVYNPNTMNLITGNGGNSVVPTINGNTPISWSLTVTPTVGGAISIATNGVITASPALAIGQYVIDVHCSNAGGSQTFSGAYTINVTAVPITFTNDILPIISAECGNCHTGGGQGPVQTNYTIYNNSVADINLILDRIQRAQGSPGFMPKNGTALSAAEIQLFIQWQNDGLLQ